MEGPFELDDVLELLLRHEISPTTLARHDDDSKWTPISILVKPVGGKEPKVPPPLARRRTLMRMFCSVFGDYQTLR